MYTLKQIIDLKAKNSLITPQEYLEAVQKDWNVFRYIPKDELSPEQCRVALEQNGLLLSEIPPTMRTPKLYLIAVKQSWIVIGYIPKDELIPAVCRAAIEQDGDALGYIPNEKRTPDLCELAVTRKGTALQYVPIDKRTPDLCKKAVEQNWAALQYVPIDKCTPELYKKAVEQNWQAIEYIPEVKRTPDLYLEVIKQGYSLKKVPEDKRSPELYLEAVKLNAHALKYVPENLKEDIIKKLSVASILSNNYLARQYFPKEPDFTNSIMQYLRSVEHVVVSVRSNDHEVRDAHLIYAHNKNNKNKAVVSIVSKNVKNDLNALMHDLSQANNANKLHLTLIGHAHVASTKLAGLDVEDMVFVCENHKSIQHIHLFGCNTGKAKQTKAEKEMLAKFTKKKEKQSNLQYGLMTALDAPVDQEEFLKFKSKCLDFCKNNNLDGVYIISKKANSKNADEYQLISLKYDKDKNIIKEGVRVRNIPAGSKISLASKALNFGSDKKKRVDWGLNPIRGKGNPLSADELFQIRGLAETAKRFDKVHPKYKKDKTMYPFLTKVEAVYEELEPSLLKKLADKLKNNDKIQRDITLYAPTKYVYVDTAEKNFKTTVTKLYYSNYHTSFFNSGKSNIHYKKLNDDRRREIKLGANHTLAKQLKITIKSENLAKKTVESSITNAATPLEVTPSQSFMSKIRQSAFEFAQRSVGVPNLIIYGF